MKKAITCLTLFLTAAPAFAQFAHPDRSIVPAATQSYANFGASIDFDGDRAVVGAPSSQFTGLGLFGSAFVVERNPSGQWITVQQLLPSSTSVLSVFGGDVELEGDWVVGTNYPNSSPMLHFYQRDASGTWIEKQNLAPSVSAMDKNMAIDFDGGRLVVGMRRTAINLLGQVAVIELLPNGIWQSAYVVQPDSSSFELESIDLDGDRFVIGAPRSSSNAGQGSGSAIVFERNSIGEWVQVATLQARLPEADARLGMSVALQGDLIVAGAPRDPNDEPANRGTVHVFRRASSGVWNEVQVLEGSPSASTDRFGGCVAFDGTRLVVGAPRLDAEVDGSGAVHVFELDGAGQFQPLISVVRETPSTFDLFGSVAAIGEDELFLGTTGTGTGVVESVDLASLYHGDRTISLSAGGTQDLLLRGPASTAGDFYFVLGSATGSSPGIPLAPGVDVPLVFDAYTELALSLAIPVAPQFGVLDARGAANAKLVKAPGTNPAFAGLTLHHAYITIDPVTFEVFASNAVGAALVP
jgi:hypothetical protein